MNTITILMLLAIPFVLIAGILKTASMFSITSYLKKHDRKTYQDRDLLWLSSFLWGEYNPKNEVKKFYRLKKWGRPIYILFNGLFVIWFSLFILSFLVS